MEVNCKREESSAKILLKYRFLNITSKRLALYVDGDSD